MWKLIFKHISPSLRSRRSGRRWRREERQRRKTTWANAVLILYKNIKLMLNWSLLQNKMFTSTFCCSYSVQSSDPSENYWHFNVCCLKTGSPSSSSRSSPSSSSPASCPSPDPPESVRHPGADHAGKSLLFVGGEVVLGGAANLKVG